jgi:two-component system invasion response regulator UvrY
MPELGGEKIKILVADDQIILRKGIEMILSDTDDIVVTGEASDGDEVLQELERNSFDLLLLDISMPKKSGFEVLKEIIKRGHTIPVLILSTFADRELAELAFKEGASGFLTKDDIPASLIDAIRRISQDK